MTAPKHGPPKRVGPDADNAEAKPTTSPNCASEFSNSSRQVSWWDVREFVVDLIGAAADFPMLGTPEWCSLDDDDPRKIASLLDGAQHHALRVEIAQEAECLASRDVSAAADWSAIAHEIRQMNEFYAAKPYLRRVAS